jgi:hypothetical protein
MTKDHMIGKLLAVTGSLLAVIGVVLLIVKDSLIVTFMSLPLILIGIVISHNPKKDPPPTKGQLEDS